MFSPGFVATLLVDQTEELSERRLAVGRTGLGCAGQTEGQLTPKKVHGDRTCCLG
jgi:hypothetical protein